VPGSAVSMLNSSERAQSEGVYVTSNRRACSEARTRCGPSLQAAYGRYVAWCPGSVDLEEAHRRAHALAYGLVKDTCHL